MDLDTGKNTSNSPPVNYHVALPLALLVFVGFSLLFPPVHSMWVDETSSYFFSSLPWDAFLEHLAKAEANMSLYYVALKLHMLTGVESPFYLRALSVVFGLLSIVCMYQFSRIHISRQVAFWVAIVAAFNPFIYKYFWEARSYSLTLLFGCINLWLFWNAISRNCRTTWVIYGLVAGIGLYSHIFLALMVIAQYAFALLYTAIQRNFSSYFFNLLLAGCILSCIAAPLLYFFIAVGADAANINWIKTAGISNTWGLLENVYKSKYSYSRLATNFSWLLLVFTFIASAYIVIRDYIQHRLGERDYLIVYLGMCTSIPIALAFMLQYARPMFVERYLIYVTPSLLILTCLVIFTIRKRLPRMALLSALCITQAYGMYDSHHRNKFDYYRLYDDLAANCEPGTTLIFANASVATTYLYHRSLYPALSNCVETMSPDKLDYTNFYHILEFEELPKLDPGKRLWVILGHVTDSDKSIHKLHDEDYLAAHGYSRTFYKQYPINLALIQLQGRTVKR